MKNEKKIELLYQEYVRLNRRLDFLIESALGYFKMLGIIWSLIIGLLAILGNQKILSSLFSNYDTTDDHTSKASITSLMSLADITFLIFVILLAIITIIGFRNLVKISLVNFHIYTIKTYELELVKHFDNETHAFDNINIWTEKFSKNHTIVYNILAFLVIFSVSLISIYILYQFNDNNPKSYHWLYYIVLAVIVYASHIFVLRKYLIKPLLKLSLSQKNKISQPQD